MERDSISVIAQKSFSMTVGKGLEPPTFPSYEMGGVYFLRMLYKRVINIIVISSNQILLLSVSSLIKSKLPKSISP